MENIVGHTIFGVECVACILVFYCAVLCVYRLFFHPLSHVPGPFLAKLSDGYAGYFALQRSLHIRTHLDHERYGNVMRYGPNRLIFRSTAAVYDIYQNPRVTKSTLYSLVATEGSTFVFNAVSPEAHFRKRKIIAPALADRSVRLFEPTVVEQLRQFLGHLSGAVAVGRPVNLTDQCKRLTMDVAGHLGFGFPLNLQETDTHRFILDGISFANYRINTYMNFPFLTNLQLDYLFKLSPIRNKWRGLIEKMVATRLAQGRDAIHDFYSFVAGNLDVDTKDFQDSELFGESIFFMSAGGDTVSCAIAALFFYLSRYPTCYEKVAREIRTTFKAESEIRGGPKLASCSYLRACIDEAMRLSPPLAGTLWRQLDQGSSGGPFIVDGVPIPCETHVGVNTYALHHSEEYFPDPFVFKPERWLTTTTGSADAKPGSAVKEIATAATQRAFVPFSVGVRSCAGKSLAYLEASLAMALTLWHFDFERPRGRLGAVGGGGEALGDGRADTDEFQLYDALTARHDGPYLVFQARAALDEKRER